MNKKQFKEKVKEEVRDTLEFKSGDINGRLLFYLAAKHFVLNLSIEERELLSEIHGELFKEVYNSKRNMKKDD